MIRIQLTLAGLAMLAAFVCFKQLPNRGDGSLEEATPRGHTSSRLFDWDYIRASLAPLRDRRFRRFLAVIFVYCCGNMFYMGIVPAVFGRDLGLGYVRPLY